MSTDWPHRVTIYSNDWPEIQDWCLKNIGEFSEEWFKLGVDPADFLNGKTRTVWFFKTSEHATLFSLRWA